MHNPRKYHNQPYCLPEQHLLPPHPLAHRFFHYFHHAWDYILKPHGGEWRTYSQFPLKPRPLWRCYRSNKITVGLRFGRFTNYGLIDIDAHSPYHPNNNPVAYRRLLKLLKKLGILHTLTITSSDSGGLHVYFFLPEQVSSFALATGLKQIFTKAGLEIRPGWLEIFPNTKRYGKSLISLYNGHRLPLQQGSYLLDDRLQPVSNNLADFLDAADRCAQGQNVRKLKRAIGRAYQWFKNTSKAWDEGAEGGIGWRSDLEYRIEQGWTGCGQTNELLKDIANYGWVFAGSRTVSELAHYIHQRAIALPGYQQWCRHQHHIQQRCTDWAKAAVEYWSPYPSVPQRSITYQQLYQQANAVTVEYSPSPAKPPASGDRPSTASSRRTRRQVNQERQQDSLHRLKATIAHLEKLRLLPQKIGDRIEAICRASKELFDKGFSRKTLLKALYLPLWHPKHRSTESVADEPTQAHREADIFEIAAPNINDPPPASAATPMTTIRQPEPPEGNNSSESPHVSDVVRDSAQKSASPQPLSSKDSSQKDPTIMKCFEPPSADTDKVEIMLNSDREKSVQHSSYRTVDQKLKQTKAMVGKIYRYIFNNTSGLIDFNNSKQPQLHSISSNSLVTVLDSYHGSSLSDNDRPLIVYVKPIDRADDWLNGISVSENHLQPIDHTGLYPQISSAPPIFDKQNLSNYPQYPPDSGENQPKRV